MRLRMWRRLPLTLKMLTVIVAVGLAIGFVTGRYIDRVVANLFEVHLHNLLEKQSQEDRLRFDHYRKNFLQVASLTVSQKNFHDYLASKDWFRRERGEVLYLRKVPPWYLRTSTLRALAVPRFVFLFDARGRLREIFSRSDESLPPELLRPTPLLIEKSLGEAHIALIDDFPFMIASEEYEAPEGKALLIAASPIDDRFLLATQGDFPKRLIGLLSEDGSRLLTSNNTELLPPGEEVEKMREKFVITGRSYHDYGGAEMPIRISSFVPTEEIEEMAALFIEKEQGERMVTTLVFIFSFTLLMLWITARVRRVTNQVEEFSAEALGGDLPPLPSGDRLEMLAERFSQLKKEVLRSHDKIRRESEERASRQLALERQERMLSLLRAVTDSVEIGVLVGEREDLTPANDLMVKLKEEFGELKAFTVDRGVSEERTLRDLTGSARVFRLNSPGIIAAEEVVLVNEVTEQKRAQREQERLQSELNQAQKMESIGRLAGGVAHDFNNILTAIIGYAEITLRTLGPESPLRDNVAVIIESGERAAKLTSQLLAFSRKQSYDPSVLNMNNLVGGLYRMLARIIGEAVTITFEEGEGLWNVMADAGHMEQMVVNLAINARDAMPEGGELVIRTENAVCGKGGCQEDELLPAGDYVLLTISDSGSGIREEDMEHVFEPFFTTKEAGKGTGLGLSTVYGIVKQSEGHVFLQSRIGEGTTFRIYLPRTRKELRTSLGTEEELIGGNETILLVEDQMEVRKLALLILSELGYTVIEAGDGIEAIELSRKFHGTIHLLLTDMVMPGMGGQELAKRIRAIDGSIRILFMTGYAEDLVAYQSPFQVLMKPLSASALAKAVREALTGAVPQIADETRQPSSGGEG